MFWIYAGQYGYCEGTVGQELYRHLTGCDCTAGYVIDYSLGIGTVAESASVLSDVALRSATTPSQLGGTIL